LIAFSEFLCREALAIVIAGAFYVWSFFIVTKTKNKRSDPHAHHQPGAVDPIKASRRATRNFVHISPQSTSRWHRKSRAIWHAYHGLHRRTRTSRHRRHSPIPPRVNTFTDRAVTETALPFPGNSFPRARFYFFYCTSIAFIDERGTTRARTGDVALQTRLAVAEVDDLDFLPEGFVDPADSDSAGKPVGAFRAQRQK